MKSAKWTMVVAMLVSGIAGGITARWGFDSLPSAAAQDEKAGQVLRAGRFELVDSKGKVRGAFFVDEAAKADLYTRLEMYGIDGDKEVVLQHGYHAGPLNKVSALRLGVWGDGPRIDASAGVLGAKIEASTKGKVVWSAP